MNKTEKIDIYIYIDLAGELMELRRISDEVVSVVIGVLGTVAKESKKNTGEIGN